MVSQCTPKEYNGIPPCTLGSHKFIVHMIMSLSCLKHFTGSHCPQDEGQVAPMTWKAFCFLAPVCLFSLIFLHFLPWIPVVLPYPILLMFSHQPGILLACLMHDHFLRCSDIAHYPQKIPPPPLSLGEVLLVELLQKPVPPIFTLAVCMCLNNYLFTMCSLVWGSLGENTAPWSLNLYHLTMNFAHNRHSIE